MDLFYEEKGKKKTSSKKILGVYQAERLIGRKQDADVSKTSTVPEEEILFLSLVLESLEPSLYPVKHLWIYSNKQNDDQVKFGVVKLSLFLV